MLDDLGLLSALESLIDELARDGVETDLAVRGNARRLSPETELVLFRIAQEALRNIRKHAEASKVAVEVQFEESGVRLTIRDDGKGFDVSEVMSGSAEIGKLGLIGMQERVQLIGGALSIHSELGKGTAVDVNAPL
jgi:signal transduction histidine kinase